jgi:hypothetical protein
MLIVAARDEGTATVARTAVAVSLHALYVDMTNAKVPLPKQRSCELAICMLVGKCLQKVHRGAPRVC